MPEVPKKSHLLEYAQLVKSMIDEIFQKVGRIQFSQDSTIQIQDIIEYDQRMIASGLEKFNNSGYVFAANFFKSPPDQKDQLACGAFVLYLNDDSIEHILKGFGLPKIDIDNAEDVLKTFSDHCKNLSEQFNQRLSARGSRSLILSEPFAHRNSIPQGVPFDYNQYEKVEIAFSIKGVRAFAIDLTLPLITR